ncbi:proline iminopeptidase-family hydrolase [Flavobacteriaceae bacterium]|nr:proline iminopeptidase-family hydrolase [Flavobacteriaceae bacterium]
MNILRFLFIITLFLGLNSCEQKSTYLDYSKSDSQLSGGTKMIPVKTALGTFNVWTKQVGNNPKIKVLLLHGGPGATSEYWEAADSYFPNAGIQYFYYDQLGSGKSENPNDERLWNVDRFVDEVEQVRKALGLDASNFIILGHSWGGILGLEYAIKYQENLKGLIISNMVSSIPDYIDYANKVLGPQLPEEVLKKIKFYEQKEDYSNPEYLGLIEEYYYPKHVLRMSPSEWPNPVLRAFANLNYPLYLKMQGPSEFGVVGNAILKGWDRTNDLSTISIPTLTIGAKYDTMDPKAMEKMSKLVQNGKYLYCPEGSHLAMYDDQNTYFRGVIDFLNAIE